MSDAPEAHDPRAAEVMTRYLAILNDIQALGVRGFAQLIDTALPGEVSDLLRAAEIVEGQIARYRKG